MQQHFTLASEFLFYWFTFYESESKSKDLCPSGQHLQEQSNKGY